MAISCSEVIMYVDQTHISRPGGTALLPDKLHELPEIEAMRGSGVSLKPLGTRLMLVQQTTAEGI